MVQQRIAKIVILKYTMKNKTQIILWSIVLTGTVFLTSTSLLERKSAFKSYGKSEPSKVYALDVAPQYTFAGETVTLDDPDLHERMDKELLVNTYWQSNMMLMIKRSAKYFPMIERILKEEGVPDDFKYLAVIEKRTRECEISCRSKRLLANSQINWERNGT